MEKQSSSIYSQKDINKNSLDEAKATENAVITK